MYARTTRDDLPVELIPQILILLTAKKEVGPVQGSNKSDFAILYYTVARSNASKRNPILVLFWGPVLSKNEKRGFQKSTKNQFQKMLKMDHKRGEGKILYLNT